jgi:uncharacterized protein (DUF2252 family)
MPATTAQPPTSAESAAAGRFARRAAPRSEHGGWAPEAGRRDPVEILREQDASRVPELVPIRHGRMLASPFAFYRGAAAIMAADLAATPTSGLRVQLCGDAHLSNFGVFAAPDRRLVFDLNDFDETLAGPWEWDVKRLAASAEIAGRDRGFTSARRKAIVRGAVRSYRETMRHLATMRHLDVWYARIDVEDALAQIAPRASDADVRAARGVTAKARAKDSSRALAKLTERVDGELRFRSEPPLLERLEDLLPDSEARVVDDDLRALLDEYSASLAPALQHLISTYRFVDIARKVVGVGSVGTRAWVILLQGRDEADPLVLQAKEAQTSVLEAHLDPSPYANHGERVVHGQRSMQAASDILLGWQSVTGIDGRERDFYLRQLWDGKGSAEVESMSAERMAIYSRLCGATLARAHARSGDRTAIAAYLGGADTFDRAIARFAAAYADQNELDFGALERAVEDDGVGARMRL